MLNLRGAYLKLMTGGLLVLTSSACAGVGMETLADVLAGGGGVYDDQISGEIRNVDTRRQEISISSGWSGEERVRYDNRTTVQSGQRRFDVRDLRRGDRVRVIVSGGNDRRYEAYARRIEVERSAVRDQPRHEDVRNGGRNLVRLEGNVVWVDQRSGNFDLQSGRGPTVRVTVANETSREARDRARGLRRGQRVRIEAQLTDNDRARLFRFI